MNEKELRLHKVLSAVDAVLSVAIVVGILLYFTGVWKDALNMCVPLLGVSIAISSVRFWKNNRTIAIVCLFAAVFIFACCIGVFLL